MTENINPGQPLTPAVLSYFDGMLMGKTRGYSIMKDVEKQTGGKIETGAWNALWIDQAYAVRRNDR